VFKESCPLVVERRDKEGIVPGPVRHLQALRALEEMEAGGGKIRQRNEGIRSYGRLRAPAAGCMWWLLLSELEADLVDLVDPLLANRKTAQADRRGEEAAAVGAVCLGARDARHLVSRAGASTSSKDGRRTGGIVRRAGLVGSGGEGKPGLGLEKSISPKSDGRDDGGGRL
jgi:hypothetical protein